jgi:hypothetical protein
MRDAATDSERSRRRTGRKWLFGICGAFVALQILVVTLLPPHARSIAAGLLTMVTVVVLITVAMEVSFKRAEVRATEGTAYVAPRPRLPRERASPLMQRAYYLARHDASASHIARSCDIPEAFAVLVIDDVRRSAPRKGRAARTASARSDNDRRRPKNRTVRRSD